MALCKYYIKFADAISLILAATFVIMLNQKQITNHIYNVIVRLLYMSTLIGTGIKVYHKPFILIN